MKPCRIRRLISSLAIMVVNLTVWSEMPTGSLPKARIGAYGEETYDDDDDDFDYDDEDYADDMSTEWNLRKCAAAALDVLAVRFTGDLLNVLLGPLKDKLWSSDWLQRGERDSRAGSNGRR